MKTVFADTFYFLALLNRSDNSHSKAVQFTSAHSVRLLTTEWVMTELADGLSISQAGRIEFLGILADLQTDSAATIVPFSQSLMTEAVRLYSERLDKQWSLTDCTSFLAMQNNSITEALTGDHHFEQAGFVALLK